MGAGKALAAGFYRDVVARLVGVPHAAALVGEGSEVLGFDDSRSTDHAWGPRLHVFVAPGDVGETQRRVTQGLPETYRSYPVEFFAWQDQRVRHHVTVTTVEEWVRAELGQPVPSTLADWLGLPQQRLLQVTAGEVFHDDRGDLGRVRGQLGYFPDDVWWWIQASQWQLVARAEALPGRLAEVHDVLGVRVREADLARLLMELALVQRRRYVPYPKWLGAAFGQLDTARELDGPLGRLLSSEARETREAAAAAALEAAARQHNRLVPEHPLDPGCAPFEVGINGARRPYRVLNAGRFVEACLARVTDPGLARLLPVGAIDQLTHGSDAMVNVSTWPSRLTATYAAMLESGRNRRAEP
ncbi:protein of unknown function [Microlunatus sagamiharensis]|uniref:DUF4037 domain-containing protein n=1 Tax=Microlunatus sagamiharensis TaxID=546874 RepID=A0A1H2LF51_9ACTN|nr:DUF4037 domain-containing protein [Microlunatus sagamiharensis]SDU79650.1 protein of unknown function [Microlunatus sagamiharensis]SDV05167.1 protein of unknown function [Microlunatus sagamiharensis]